MITIPNLKPALLKNLETDFGTSIAAAIWLKIKDNNNWLNKNLPVGIIMWFYASQTYSDSSVIDSPGAQWQICDGSAITDTNSPLLGQNTPDFRQKFLTGDATPDLIGGTDSMNLSHNHSGQTGFTLDIDSSAKRSSLGFERYGYNNHNHAIFSSLGNIQKLPPYVDLQPYLRII